MTSENTVNGKIIFEGEYFKGERWNGKVKEYDNNGGIINEKEYFNGKIIEDYNEKLNCRIFLKFAYFSKKNFELFRDLRYYINNN